MKSSIKKIADRATRPRRLQQLRLLRDQGLPLPVSVAASFLLGESAQNTDSVISVVESRRQEIAQRGTQSVEILYSPRPGSTGFAPTADIRPEPGATLNFTMERVAKTGKDSRWGAVLYLLARESKAQVILELGACAGISGAYLASSEYCQTFHTIDGSPALCELARESLAKVTDSAEVHNGLFDDVLDELLPQLPRVDLAYIDGHHEKIATIHYWERIAPSMSAGGVVVFDDISWSEDMRDAWRELSTRRGFSHVADLGAIGICICGTDGQQPKYWDLQPVVGRCRIGNPHGWARRQGELVT